MYSVYSEFSLIDQSAPVCTGVSDHSLCLPAWRETGGIGCHWAPSAALSLGGLSGGHSWSLVEICAVSCVPGRLEVSWHFSCLYIDGNLFLGDYDAAFFLN